LRIVVLFIEFVQVNSRGWCTLEIYENWLLSIN
jgi:hypothetical protein